MPSDISSTSTTAPGLNPPRLDDWPPREGSGEILETPSCRSRSILLTAIPGVLSKRSRLAGGTLRSHASQDTIKPFPASPSMVLAPPRVHVFVGAADCVIRTVGWQNAACSGS